MIDTLFGRVCDNKDFARKIITKGMNMPFYRVRWQMTAGGISFDICHDDTLERDLAKAMLKGGGFYSIYRKKNNDMECLYVGMSSSSIEYRIYRFFKELAGKSRPDEDHPGARKALLDGVKVSDDFYIKIMALDDLPSMPENGYYVLEKLDESIAFLLKAKYNTYVQK